MTQDGGHGAKALVFSSFDWSSFPSGVERSDPVDYIRCYLADLGAQALIEEPYYFDRDYLAEFSAFYATSSRGYPNVCRRVHVFGLSLAELRDVFDHALCGQNDALEKLQQCYCGFLVIRPIQATPFGRTVLRWYPETNRAYRRVVRPARDYKVHLAGLPLTIKGLAWQQQDAAVGACATIALWTMLHSSALDEHHSVPTTVEITRAAKNNWPLSRRIFPASDGLVVEQLCHAIKAQGLSPTVLQGDRLIENGAGLEPAFSRERFAASCAAWIRSGYPALIACYAFDAKGNRTQDHAVCAVGFRPGTPTFERDASEDDECLQHLYIHDDNLGPSVRFALGEERVGDEDFAVLTGDSPPALQRTESMPNPTLAYGKLVPYSLVAAFPDEIRMSVDFLNRLADQLSYVIARYLRDELKQAPRVTFSASFLRVREYLGEELALRLEGEHLRKARISLVETVRPMSLHLGIVRIGVDGAPVFDVLFDTTDSEPATDAFAHVLFQDFSTDWLTEEFRLGVKVIAY